jgi:hypothetical protein
MLGHIAYLGEYFKTQSTTGHYDDPNKFLKQIDNKDFSIQIFYYA